MASSLEPRTAVKASAFGCLACLDTSRYSQGHAGLGGDGGKAAQSVVVAFVDHAFAVATGRAAAIVEQVSGSGRAVAWSPQPRRHPRACRQARVGRATVAGEHQRRPVRGSQHARTTQRGQSFRDFGCGRQQRVGWQASKRDHHPVESWRIGQGVACAYAGKIGHVRRGKRQRQAQRQQRGQPGRGSQPAAGFVQAHGQQRGRG